MRTLLTIIGIAIGVASVVVIANISQCGTDAVSGEMDSLGLSGLLITKSGQSESASLDSQDLNVIENGFDFEITTKGGFSQRLNRNADENSILPQIKYIPQNYLVKLAEPELNKKGKSLNKVLSSKKRMFPS